MKKELIWLIQRIPYGMVVSYGGLAVQLDRQYGIHTSGWLVGRMMNNMNWYNPLTYPKSTSFGAPLTGGKDIWCPRRRVVNKQWVISALKLWQRWLDQIKLLQSEWIKVLDGQVNMKVYSVDLTRLRHPLPVGEGSPLMIAFPKNSVLW